MTKEQLAADLSGAQYGDEMTLAQEEQAKDAGLVVVFGYSDDNTELRGAIEEEVSGFGDHCFDVRRDGVIQHPDEDERDVLEKFGVLEAATKGREINAIWGREGYSWTYETEIPHATFEVMEDEDKYCRGIVFSVSDL